VLDGSIFSLAEAVLGPKAEVSPGRATNFKEGGNDGRIRL
jgi:hypothetical protein